MEKIINDTILYYDRNADDFVASTQAADISNIQSVFLEYLNPEAEILDFGCGSGRDTKYFRSLGYKVTAADGSEEICRAAEEFLGYEIWGYGG